MLTRAEAFVDVVLMLLVRLTGDLDASTKLR